MINPTPLLLRETLRIARDARASDVHLSAGVPVALRIDGNLEQIGRTPVTSQDIGDIVAHCFDETAVKSLNADGDATVTHYDEQTHFTRIHAFRSGANYALALRLLALEIPSLESLRLPAGAAQLIQRNHGLIIVSAESQPR